MGKMVITRLDFTSIRRSVFRWMAGGVVFCCAIILTGCGAEIKADGMSLETPLPVGIISSAPTEPTITPPPATYTETPLPTSWYFLNTPTPEVVQAHLSFYWPPYRDMNCDVECEHLANMDDWQQWVGKGVACPIEYDIGTVFVIRGQKWTCVDRGGAIITNEDGSIWLDMLMPYMPYGIAWGTLSDVRVIRNYANNSYEN